MVEQVTFNHWVTGSSPVTPTIFLIKLMKLSIKVITNAKKEKIDCISENEYKVYLTCIPEKGKANKALLELLSDYFKISKSKIKIVSGEKSHNKIIEIE